MTRHAREEHPEMVTVGMNYMVIPGKEAIFENAVRGVLDVMQQDPAHVKTDLYRGVTAEGSYLIVSEWQSKEAFQLFTRSPLFAKVTNWGAEQILAGRPKHTVYES